MPPRCLATLVAWRAARTFLLLCRVPSACHCFLTMLKHRIDIKELEGMQDSMIKELRERDVQLSDIQSKLDKCQEAKVRLLL